MQDRQPHKTHLKIRRFIVFTRSLIFKHRMKIKAQKVRYKWKRTICLISAQNPIHIDFRPVNIFIFVYIKYKYLFYFIEIMQIENEYGPVEWEIGAPAKAYTWWAAQMAVGLNTGVPWIMCKQDKDVPEPIVSTFFSIQFGMLIKKN